MLKPGRHFLNGNVVVAEAALKAGCKFYAGYPITPSSEVMEQLSTRMEEEGGVFIQMEDEIASISAIIGASWIGKKSMTATSGPGLSLMQENLGYAVMTETPIVIVDSQRGGPSTGQPTLAANGDIMQVRWGSHGDYKIIALAPNSIQETFDLTIEAFNLSEKYRVPVVLLIDAELSHMRESFIVREDIELIERKTHEQKEVSEPFKPEKDLIPRFPEFGHGHNVHVTGLTHDEKGYPKTVDGEIQDILVRRLVNKIANNEAQISSNEIINPDAEKIIVAYGTLSRAVYPFLNDEIGLFRPKTIWPFPKTEFSKVVKGKEIFVMEMNLGQYYCEVERYARRYGCTDIHLYSYIKGGVPNLDDVKSALKKQGWL